MYAIRSYYARRLAADTPESSRVEFREGRAESLPLRDEERGHFDLAHARYLLEHHREHPRERRREVLGQTACVITSYSIHYTKLYEHAPQQSGRAWQLNAKSR